MERRESPAGFHYHSTYRECPRKFFLAYVLGLRPTRKMPALSFGSALHEATGEFLRSGGDLARAKATLAATLEAAKGSYEDEAAYRLDLDRAPLLLEHWAERFGAQDLAEFDVLGVEEELTVPIGPPEAGYVFTVRLDRVYRERRTGNVYIVEFKTTGWGADKMWDKTARSQQITAELWAVSKVHPEWAARAAIVEVLYQRTQKGRVVGQPLATRGPSPVFRSKFDLNVFELGMFGTMVEIAQKVEGLKRYPWPMLFPRHDQCAPFGHDCEFADVCSSDVKPGDVVPGYEHDPRVSREVDERFRKLASYSLEDIEVTWK